VSAPRTRVEIRQISIVHHSRRFAGKKSVRPNPGERGLVGRLPTSLQVSGCLEASGNSKGPRVTPLPEQEWNDGVRDILNRTIKEGPGGKAENIYATLARAPVLLRRMLPFAGTLNAGEINPVDRELLILRTAWNCSCEYEWGHHTLIAKHLGVSQRDVDRIAAYPLDRNWEHHQAMLLDAADDLHHRSAVNDDLWFDLREEFSEQQLIELPLLVGMYHALAFALTTLGVQREQGVPGFSTPRPG